MKKILSRPHELIITLALLLAITVPRFYANDRPVTIDEWTWMNFSANFYYALGQREFDQTYQDHHPGITTMIAGAAALHLTHPEYRGYGQGFFTEDALGFLKFIQEKGWDPLALLVFARQLMVLMVSVTMLACLYYAWRLLGFIPAVFGVLFIALDPFHIGHSRLLTHEALMSVLTLLSLLSFMVYLYSGNSRINLIVSGIAASLAVLTKITALPIILFLGGIIILKVLDSGWGRLDRNKKISVLLNSVIFPMLIWAIVFVVVFVLVWPGMWVAPSEMLSKVFGLGFQGFGNQDVLSTGGSPFLEKLWRGTMAYGRGIIVRQTPLHWLGIIFSFLLVIFYKITKPDSLFIRTSIYLFLFAVFFFIGLGYVGSRLVGHYVLVSHVWLDMLAGMGFAGVLMIFKERVKNKLPETFTWAVLGIVLVGLSLSALRVFPYYFTYYNPIWGKQYAKFGYAALLDQAADYLAQKPNAEELTVYAFYGTSSFSFYFPGKTIFLTPYPDWGPDQIENLQNSDYLVIYYPQFGRKIPTKLIADLQGVIPEHIVEFDGLEYVYIYEVSQLPLAVFKSDPDYDK